MMVKRRNKYTAAQKAKIALAALKGDKTMNELTREYGIHASQINNWKKNLKEGIVQIFERKRGRRAKGDDELVEELYKEIGRLKVERDWLKKKAELFS
jgi:transposase-like protein